MNQSAFVRLDLRRWGVLAALAIALSGSFALEAAYAQTSTPYPTRPLTLMAPFPPGGPPETNGRLVAQKLAAALGQPVVVDDRPGASRSLGTEIAARAPEDGYTILTGTKGTLALNPVLQGNV